MKLRKNNDKFPDFPYCYSLDEEHYSEPYDTREEALKAAIEDNESNDESNRYSEAFIAEVDKKRFIGYLDREVCVVDWIASWSPAKKDAEFRIIK